MVQHVNTLHTNFDVDYVIVYRFTDTSKAAATEGFARLLKALASVGLQIEVRNGDNCSLLVLLKVASSRVMNHHVYRSRCRHWFDFSDYC